MNSIKSVLVAGVLLAVAGGVYVAINNKPDGKVPPEVEQAWSDKLNVQMPQAGSWARQAPFGRAGSSRPSAAASGTNAQAAAAPESGAPPFAASSPPDAVQGERILPPFQPRSHPSTSADHNPLPGRNSDRLAPPSHAASASAGLGRPPDDEIPTVFARFMELAERKLDEGRLGEALEALSQLYGDPKLTAEQSRQMTELLDQVAGTVIYSRQHLLEPPHKVQPGETLEQIAERYNVPWQLLAKINGVRDPSNLPPGRELKVVRGPFSAVIDPDNYELTLMLEGRYAGRFAIGIGRDQRPLEGTYVVKDKTINPTYYGPDQVIDADDPNNPLGERWIGLGHPGASHLENLQLGIHGTDNPQNVRSNQGRGSICLGERDIEDLYDILSIGSRVVIRR